jgi:outer membrane protein OmpA-like peptidoglycan-associated protein
MQKLKQSALILTALAIGAIGLGGCATEDYVNKQVSAEDAKSQAATQAATQAVAQNAQAQLDAHQAHLGRLDQATQDALDRAKAAGKLAEGKFLYSMVLSDDSVKFLPESSKLSAEAQARLLDFVQKLKTDNRNVYLEIQGHTDATGPEAANQRLGEERAEAVRLFMNQQGVALNRMSTISYGSKSPVASNKTKAGRAQNRRVVVIVLA